MIGLKSHSNDGFRRWALGWLPFGFYSVFVFWSAVLPPNQFPVFLTAINDKIFHACQYFLLGLLGLNVFRQSQQVWIKSRIYRNAFIYCILMGLLTEHVQFYIPGRFSEWADLLADAIGAFMAISLWMIAHRLKRSRSLG